MSASQRNDDLERALVEIGRRLDAPEGSFIHESVRRRITDERATQRAKRRRLTPRLRIAFVVGLAAVLMGTSVLVFSPTARRAVANWLGVPGVRIRHEPSPLPSPPPSPTANVTPNLALGLGDLVTLEEAFKRARFGLVPLLAGFQKPDQVYFSDQIPGGQIAFVYAPRADLPVTKETGVGLLLMQFRGGLGERSIYLKGAPRGTVVEPVTVNRNEGYWFEGSPHSFSFTDENGEPRTESFRLAGNTLLWEQNGLTIRIESALDKDQVLRIAESLH